MEIGKLYVYVPSAPSTSWRDMVRTVEYSPEADEWLYSTSLKSKRLSVDMSTKLNSGLLCIDKAGGWQAGVGGRFGVFLLEGDFICLWKNQVQLLNGEE
jgi:hypothetical protein